MPLMDACPISESVQKAKLPILRGYPVFLVEAARDDHESRIGQRPQYFLRLVPRARASTYHAQGWFEVLNPVLYPFDAARRTSVPAPWLPSIWRGKPSLSEGRKANDQWRDQ